MTYILIGLGILVVAGISIGSVLVYRMNQKKIESPIAILQDTIKKLGK